MLIVKRCTHGSYSYCIVCGRWLGEHGAEGRYLKLTFNFGYPVFMDEGCVPLFISKLLGSYEKLDPNTTLLELSEIADVLAKLAS